MNRLTSRSDALDSVLLDGRLRFFQRFTTGLLQRLPQLDGIQEQEGVEALHKELLTKLAEERARSEDVFGEEPFLLASGLADELLQHAEWFGQVWWKEHLLEQSLFGTRTVGDRFYTILDQVLTERKQKDLPLAMMLLDSLALGFYGRYADDEVQRDRHRNELGTWIQSNFEQDVPGDFVAETFHSPHRHALQTIPSLKRWMLCAFCLAFGLLLASHFIWQHNIKPLRDFFLPTNVSMYSITEEGEQ
ncbi:MAG: DotU family type IV/VI secretion system protein [Planctomycetaceae bacterium]|nr:DotU family type IV/VI secretion system protein [Planctomycetaceae bacterium]